MQRVRFIYNAKAVGHLLLAKAAILASLLAISGFFVSIPNVLKNMPSLFDISNVALFSLSAFENTDFMIQIISIGTVVVIFYIFRDIVKTFRGVRQEAFSL